MMYGSNIAVKRRRILQVMSHDKIGGVKVLAEMIQNGLDRRGYVVETLHIKSEAGILGTASNLAKIARRILEKRYDAIFSYHVAASIYANIIGYASGTKLRVPHQTATPMGLKRHWRLVDRYLGCTRAYTHIVMNSVSTTNEFSAWPEAFKSKSVLIVHGLDGLPVPSTSVNWRTKLGIPDSAFIMATTGRLESEKNHHLAVRALPQLPNAHVVIAGEGSLRSQLEEIAQKDGTSDRLHLIGEMPRSEIRGLLEAADIYIFPSKQETFGLAAVEAAMLGKPIVASNLPVLREVLDILPSEDAASAAVYFHDISDVFEFAEQVRKIQSAPPTRRTLEEFKARHNDLYSVENMISKYQEFLEENL